MMGGGGSGGAFELGAVVQDRDDGDPNPAVVVNIPPVPASEWDVYGDVTVAEDNPKYPSDATVVIVIYLSEFETANIEYEGGKPLSLKELNRQGIRFYSFPSGRLKRVGHVTDTEPSPDPPAELQMLADRLEAGGMSVNVDRDGLTAAKLGQRYRVTPEGVVEGDGALKHRLEKVVDQVLVGGSV